MDLYPPPPPPDPPKPNKEQPVLTNIIRYFYNRAIFHAQCTLMFDKKIIVERYIVPNHIYCTVEEMAP